MGGVGRKGAHDVGVQRHTSTAKPRTTTTAMSACTEMAFEGLIFKQTTKLPCSVAQPHQRLLS